MCGIFNSLYHLYFLYFNIQIEYFKNFKVWKKNLEDFLFWCTTAEKLLDLMTHMGLQKDINDSPYLEQPESSLQHESPSKKKTLTKKI